MVQELLDQDSRLLSTFHLQERLIGVVGRVVCFLLLQIAMELSAKKYDTIRINFPQMPKLGTFEEIPNLPSC